MNNLSELSAKIIEAEKLQRAAQHVDKLKMRWLALLGVGIEDEGAHSFNPDGYKITVTFAKLTARLMATSCKSWRMRLGYLLTCKAYFAGSLY